MRGPKPKPTKLKILHGEKDKKRINFNEPEPPAGAPPKPDYLDDVAGKAWDNLCDMLDRMGILTQAEAGIMEIYAQTYSNYRQSIDAVNRTGIVLLRKVGNKQVEVKRNQYSVELHKYRDALLKMQVEMGLTPSSRSRIVSTKEDGNQDGFEEFLANG